MRAIILLIRVEKNQQNDSAVVTQFRAGKNRDLGLILK